MSSRSRNNPRGARGIVLAVLFILPLIAGAVILGIRDMDPAETWSAADAATGAPTHSGAIVPADLVDARRAAGEAGTQAGLLTSGTEALAEGTQQLSDGVVPLEKGVSDAAAGADELSAGMVQLQAGTAELGVGATRVADAVGSTVDGVLDVDAIRGQLTAAVDGAVAELEGNDHPDAVAARDALLALRDQLAVVEIDPALVAPLTELRDGSREIANQLTTPGFAFHDGIYSATEGAAALNTGLAEIDTGMDTATQGVADLDAGAEQVDTMAANTESKVDEINRALPAVAPTAADAGATGDGSAQSLSPVVAMLIAALVMLIGAGIGVLAHLLPAHRWRTVAAGTAVATVAGVVALLVLATGMSPASVWLSGMVLALGTLAAAGLTALALSLFGTSGGLGVAAVIGVVQVGLVGWVWKAAAATQVVGWTQAVAGLLPLHWATASLSAAGNAGPADQLWFGVAVLAVLAVTGLAVIAPADGRGARGDGESAGADKQVET